MNKRVIKKVAILGSGVMGSRIACHFANIGCDVLLLDIAPKDAAKDASPAERNKIVNDSLKFALRSNPSPIYSKSYASRINTGNFDDDLHKISESDWVIEVIIENLDIKRSLFEKVDAVRKPGSLITTNTSGIPINMMLDGRSDDFQKHFCGTHFFNPPRYLRLLEIIPSSKTDQGIIDFLMNYGSKFLGKKTVLCKDTPAFIANRIGVYSMMSIFHLMSEMGLTVAEVDKLTGPVLGHPKSATFRTSDVVGLDTLVHVADGLKQNCPNDEANELFTIPDYIQQMVDKEMLGTKSKQGFYKKIKDENGKSEILSLNLNTLEYEPSKKAKFPTLEMTKPIENLRDRIPVLFSGQDKAGEFYRHTFIGLFQYCSNRIPEITDSLYKVDDAICSGFAWEIGPFETWDLLGVKKVVSAMEKANQKPAQWVYDMLESGIESFFKIEAGIKNYYEIESGNYKPMPGQDEMLLLSNVREGNIIWNNSACTVTDLGDGIINLEWSTKMNTIGSEVIQGINKAIDLAESEYEGLVIYNDDANFSAGANVGLIFMLAIEQEYDELDMAVRMFQNTMMRVRYSSIPVVVAPHGLALGGGCELSLHADKVVAHAETYMGLVEFGVGLIPGGGGTKEFVLRLSDGFKDGDVQINSLRDSFLTIGQAQVATSGTEAFELGYLRDGQDEIIVSLDHQLAYAKEVCLKIANKGYTQPSPRKDITVLGNQGMGIVYVGANSMLSGNYISEHDALISEKLGRVMCGGELSKPTQVSEQYLLDMERKAFLELCTERKTLERIESIVKTGKVLRN